MKLQMKMLAASILSGFLTTTISAQAADNERPGKPEKLKPYVLKTCPVSGEKLGEMGDPYVHQHKGREIKFCCQGCLKDFAKEPAKFLTKIDDAEAKAAGLKVYPLNTCVVSDEKLDEMGEPYVHKHKDRQIKFCCEGCLKDFQKDPAKYIKKLEAEEKKARARG